MTEKCEILYYDLEPDILLEEIDKAMFSLSNGKSAGPDGIPIELIKAAGEEGVRVMTKLCNKIWKTGLWPEEWKKSVFIPIPKKGDVLECSNNRTIVYSAYLPCE
jgi:hypothetical protein